MNPSVTLPVYVVTTSSPSSPIANINGTVITSPNQVQRVNMTINQSNNGLINTSLWHRSAAQPQISSVTSVFPTMTSLVNNPAGLVAKTDANGKTYYQPTIAYSTIPVFSDINNSDNVRRKLSNIY